MLEQADKDHAAGLLFPSHKGKVPAAAEGEVRGLFWDDEESMVDHHMAPEEHNENGPAAAAPANPSAGPDVLMAVLRSRSPNPTSAS